MEDLTGQVDTVDNISALEWNNYYQEFVNLISQWETLSVGDLNQLRNAVSAIAQVAQFYTGGGTAQVQTATPVASRPRPQAYAQGWVLFFRPVANNTGAAPTLNVGGLGAKTIVREDGSPLAANDMATTRDAWLRYNGTTFNLLEFALGAPSQALPPKYRAGLTMGKFAADRIHDVDVQPGRCRDFADSVNLVLSVAHRKLFDVSAAVGNGTGGYPLASLGARAGTTVYSFWLLGHTDGSIDAGWDAAGLTTPTNLLTDMQAIDAGWTKFRQIGWSVTDTTASSLRPISNPISDPDYFHLEVQDFFDDYGSQPTVRTAVTCPVAPPGGVVELETYMRDNSGSGTNAMYGLITEIDSDNVAPDIDNHNIGLDTRSNSDHMSHSGTVNVLLDASQQYFLRYNANINGVRVRAKSFRWSDR